MIQISPKSKPQQNRIEWIENKGNDKTNTPNRTYKCNLSRHSTFGSQNWKKRKMKTLRITKNFHRNCIEFNAVDRIYSYHLFFPQCLNHSEYVIYFIHLNQFSSFGILLLFFEFEIILKQILLSVAMPILKNMRLSSISIFCVCGEYLPEHIT